MEITDYQARNIGWMLSDMIDNIEVQSNGIAKVEFAITPQTMHSIQKFLKQFKDEELRYDSKTINDNIQKINDYIEIWDKQE